MGELEEEREKLISKVLYTVADPQPTSLCELDRHVSLCGGVWE